MLRRLLIALAAGVLGLAPFATPAQAARLPGPVVLIGTGGLRWEDVDPSSTPALNGLLQDSAGLLAVRSVRTTTCPADGWLAVSAGRRAADAERRDDGCRDLTLDVPAAAGQAQVPNWAAYAQAARDESFDAHPGVLGRTVLAKGLTAAAVGPGAAIALAVPAPDGRSASVAHAWPGRTDGAQGPVDPGGLADDVRAAVASKPDLLVVDAGSIRDPAQRPDGAPAATGAYVTPRAEQVASLDTRIGMVLAELPADATVLLASLSDAGDVSQLRLVAARGPAPEPGPDGARGYGGSLLGSPSTRQDGIVQGTDLLPTLLSALGVDIPAEAVGSPLEPVPGGDEADRLQRLFDVDDAATAVHPIVPWFFNGLIIAQVLLYGVATVALRRRSRTGADPAAANGRKRTLRVLRRLAVVFAAVPAATFLANLLPWWRGALPGLWVTLAVAGFVAPIALLALLGPWRATLLGPLGVVGGVTAAVLAADVITGSHLMLSSLMGVQPVVAGRWYGFSNPGFALFATGALLLAVSAADVLVRRGRPRAATAAVVGIGVLAVVVDGAPFLGADFGGPPAMVPAFGVLALLVAGIKVTWRSMLLIAVATIVVIVGLSVLDWLRPAQQRTHLGRFVETVIDGGARSVIQRKAAQNIDILFTSWLSALLPFAVAFVVLVLARPVSWGVRPLQLAYDRSPVLKSGLIAFAILIGIGFALNDSGTVIPAVAATVAIPLLIAASVRALELDDEERLERAVTRARKPTTPRR